MDTKTTENQNADVKAAANQHAGIRIAGNQSTDTQAKKAFAWLKSNKIVAAVAVVVLLVIISRFHSSGGLVEKINESYRKNAAACMEEYDGKEVKFKGWVDSIDASLKYIRVKTGNSEGWPTSIYCYLSTEDLKKKAKKLEEGDKITVKGTLDLEVDLTVLSIDLYTEAIS